jgi:GNAT superfamily N-acetyltransferase
MHDMTVLTSLRGTARPAVRVRRIDQADRVEVSRFYATLSPESRLRRFLGTSNGIPDRSCGSLCSADHDHEEGFVADLWSAGRPGDSQIVGHVCLVRVDESTVELAVAVADEHQGQGIGRRLFEAALAWAESHRIVTVTASAFADNAPVLRLLTSAASGARVRPVGAGVVEVEIPIGQAIVNAASRFAGRCGRGQVRNRLAFAWP